MTGKLTLEQLATMAAQQADPQVPAETKRINDLLAVQELGPDSHRMASSLGMNPVAMLATQRADELEAELRRKGYRFS